MGIEGWAATHVGRRENNEDAHCAEAGLGLYAVADGMGGYEGGEVASRLVIETLTDFVRRNAEDDDVTWPFGVDHSLGLAENIASVGIRLADQEVRVRKVGRLSSMGSTVAALFVAGDRAVIAHVGDSRIYRLRDGALVQLTRDHSLYAEMEQHGMAVPSRADCNFLNVITRAIGMKGMSPDVRTEELRPGDVYVLCTDGLTETMTEDAMAEILATAEPATCAATLVRAAYERGGKDNITAIVVRVAPQSSSPESKP